MAQAFVGQSVIRLEDKPLVTGRGRFAGDINFARQLHMRIVRSNHAHANIVSIDTEAARGFPGVVAVWTAAEVRTLTPRRVDALLRGPRRDRARHVFLREVKAVSHHDLGLDLTPGACRCRMVLDL